MVYSVVELSTILYQDVKASDVLEVKEAGYVVNHILCPCLAIRYFGENHRVMTSDYKRVKYSWPYASRETHSLKEEDEKNMHIYSTFGMLHILP